MDLLKDIQPFHRGYNKLSVVTTDLVEAESLITKLAEEEKKRTPNAFGGKKACVYFKLPYIPPCDSFKELRKLILRIHESTGLRANFRGVVAIEASEWVGHEREEYFTVLLKYLYDHRDFWIMTAILNGCSPNQVSRFLSDCSRYITPRLFTINVFTDQDTLCGLIQNEFTQQRKWATQEAVKLMAKALTHHELKDSRSLTLIERSVEEISSRTENDKNVTVECIRDYLLDPYSTLTMMARKSLFDERRIIFEDEALQLRG